MNSKEVLDELNHLPKGYISKKKINGKEYNYLQFFEEGKLKSEYIAEPRFDEIHSGIIRRKELEEEIRKEEKAGKKLPVLSNNARKLTGSLMMADETVGIFENGKAIWLDQEKCPLLISRTGNLKEFLSSRIIDSNRTNARVLKKIMNITEKEDAIVCLYAHGATITDNYWFKPKQSKLSYKDIEFKDDSYADLALKGEIVFYPKSPRYTPQLTLGGSYEKCWKQIDGHWYLYKKGTEDEIFSEIFVSLLAKKLGLPSATYEYAEGYIRTLNFAERYNYEPMSAIAGEDDSYEHIFEVLKDYEKEFQKDYLKLIWFDTLVNNVDRHNENCGLLRDRETGKIISLAPNFDNNMALIARNSVLNMNVKNDGFIRIFQKFIEKNPDAANLLKETEIPELKESMIKECLEEIEIKRDEKMIAQYLITRYEYLKKLMKKEKTNDEEYNL